MTFADRLEEYGDRIALIAPSGETVSYAMLATMVECRIASLPAQRSLMALFARNNVEFVVDYLACLRGRHPVILLAPQSESSARQIIERYRPTMIGGERTDPPLLHPDLALMLSTSGTTGSPKLVRLSHQNIDSNARAIADYLRITHDTRAITSLPLHYSYGLSVLASHLSAGASIVLTETSPAEDDFWSAMTDHAVTSLAGVPYSYELFERARLRDRAPPSLRTMTQAGGRMPPAKVASMAQWAATRSIDFFVMYGQTEATARMAYLPPSMALHHPDTIGVAIPGGMFEVVDGNRKIVPPGETGELVYRGPNIMMGYAEQPDDLATGPELDTLLTGDLAVLTSDGLHKIVGRTKRFSKLFGLRISLDEVEQFAQSPEADAYATGDDEIIAIHTTGETQALRARVAERYKLPPSVIIVTSGAAPRLLTGKIDYGAILSMAHELRSTAVAGDDQVTSAFARCFPGRSFWPTDSFVGLGGDSLSYVSFAMQLEDVFGRLPDNWEVMTISQLSALVGDKHEFRRHPSIDTDVLVRAVAICGVVNMHARSHFDLFQQGAGGAELLMVLVGYNMARFQMSHLISGDWIAVLRPLLTRVLIPYYVLLLIYASFRGIDLPSLMLVSNYTGRFGNLLEPFWFVEALVQSTLIVIILFKFRVTANSARSNRWRFAVGLLIGFGLLKIIGTLILNQDYLWHRTADATLYLIGCGIAAQAATTRTRKAIAFACAIIGSGFAWDFLTSHVVWMAMGLGLLLIRDRIPLPRALRTPLYWIGSSSWEIYLTHNIVLYGLYRAGLDIFPFAQITAISAGIATAVLLRVIRAKLGNWRRGRPEKNVEMQVENNL